MAQQSCIGCHGGDLSGAGSNPDLTNLDLTHDEVVDVILNGQGAMPSMTDNEVEADAIAPIWNAQGKVVGFNGRSLGEDKPKYLNSPETPIFHKGQTLYAFHLARSEIRISNTAILFEGAVDVIAAWGAGLMH